MTTHYRQSNSIMTINVCLGFALLMLFNIGCREKIRSIPVLDENATSNSFQDNELSNDQQRFQKLNFKFNDLDLYQRVQDLNLRQFKEYGTFYTNDFTIYQINNLDLLEDNLYIKQIYLYFIDDSLHKIQAHTTKNMANFFLSKYKGAKLVLRDRFNKDLVDEEGIGERKSGKIRINRKLNNYLIKWRSNDRLISYLVDESAQKNFESLEELIDIEDRKERMLEPLYIFSVESYRYRNLLARVKYDEYLTRR